LTNLLVPLIAVSLNHQNHKQWPNGAMFLTSRFFSAFKLNQVGMMGSLSQD